MRVEGEAGSEIPHNGQKKGRTNCRIPREIKKNPARSGESHIAAFQGSRARCTALVNAGDAKLYNVYRLGPRVIFSAAFAITAFLGRG